MEKAGIDQESKTKQSQSAEASKTQPSKHEEAKQNRRFKDSGLDTKAGRSKAVKSKTSKKAKKARRIKLDTNSGVGGSDEKSQENLPSHSLSPRRSKELECGSTFLKEGLVSEESHPSITLLLPRCFCWSRSHNIKDESAESSSTLLMAQVQQILVVLTPLFLIFSNSLSFLTFSNLNSHCSEYFYEVDGIEMGHDLIAVFLLMYPIGTGITNLLVFSKGIGTSLVYGGFLTLIGFFCRCISLYIPSNGYQRYNWVLAGQVLLGIAQPMLLNPVVKISNNWFLPVERDWMVMLMYFGQPAGIVVGLNLSIIITDAGCKNGNVFRTLFSTQVITAAAAFLLSIFFKDQPEQPPSISNELMLRSEMGCDEDLSLGQMSSLVCRKSKLLMANKDYLFLAISFMCLLALSITAMMITASTSEMDFFSNSSPRTIMSCSNSFLLGTLVGCAVYASAIILTRCSFNAVLKIGFLFVLLDLLLVDLWMECQTTAMLPQIAYFMLGVGIMPLSPIFLFTASEITYGIPEEISTGVLMSLGNIAIAVKCGYFDYYSNWLRRLMNLLIAIVGCICVMLSSGLYKRAYAENTRKGVKIDEQSSLLEVSQTV